VGEVKVGEAAGDQCQSMMGLRKGRDGHGLGTGTGGNWARTKHGLGTDWAWSRAGWAQVDCVRTSWVPTSRTLCTKGW